MDTGVFAHALSEPVTTSVDGTPKRVMDAPVTMEIITEEEIRRSGAKDIPGVLRHVGGVDTLEWGNDDVDVSVRGYNQAYSPRLLVLVDGRQVNADDSGSMSWSSLPVELSMVQQIEVIKGPSSALFGFHAVRGVINIITKSPLFDEVNTVSSRAGTQADRAGSVVATHPFGSRAAARLSLGGGLDSDFATPIPKTEAVTARRQEYREAINLNGVLRLNHETQLGMEGTYSNGQRNAMLPLYRFENGQERTSSVKAQLTAQRRIGLVQASAYTNWRSETDTPGLLGQAFQFKNRATVAELHDLFQLGEHHILRAGAEYRYDTVGTSPVAGANVFSHLFAGSGMWNWTISPSLSWMNAVRMDHQRLGRDGLLPSGYPFANSDWDRSSSQPGITSALVWKVDEQNAVRAIVSRSVDLPSLTLSGSFLMNSPTARISGSPFLHPTLVTNYEVSWDSKITEGVLFRMSVFHMHTHDVLVPMGGAMGAPGGAYRLPENAGKSDANVMEIGLRGISLSHLRWGGYYRQNRIDDQFILSAQGGIAYVANQMETPMYEVKGNLGWSNARWEVDSYLHYQSRTTGLQPKGLAGAYVWVAGFVSVDGRVAYKPKRWMSWSVSGQNLSHASQVQTSGPPVERRVLSSMTMSF
jgi:outer membrane receptor for ferrienterochelin and colicins